MYNRNPQCECKDYPDIDKIPFNERKTYSKFWRVGYIYDQGTSRECECHKRYRLSSRYEVIAKSKGLPSLSELRENKYVGEGKSYECLKTLPNTMKANPSLKDIIVFMNGPSGNQKTTSAAKLMYNIIVNGQTVEYVNYVDLLQKFLDNEYKPTEYYVADYLIIDDCFDGETINFKTVYNSFYNLILKRHKPTILISDKDKDRIYDSSKPYFNKDMLDKVFKRIENCNGSLLFEDNVSKLAALKEGPIDLWAQV